jgi:urease accessory protein
MSEATIPPELLPYLDEPPQLPSGSFGKCASLRLRFETRPNRSILAVMERKAPLLVQRALYCDEGMPGLPVVFIISNSGGILQGDRYVIDISAGPGACGHVTTQAATKIHEMDANHATQSQVITLDEGSYVRHSRFLTHTRVNIAPTATLLYGEILMAGRKFYGNGESFAFDLFSSTVKAERPDGRELFVEKFIIEPARDGLTRRGVMQDFDVFGNVLLLTPREHVDAIAPRLPATWNREEGWAAGASRLPNDAGLVYKVVGRETVVVRRKVREFWSLVRPQVAGYPVPPEFAWR